MTVRVSKRSQIRFRCCITARSANIITLKRELANQRWMAVDCCEESKLKFFCMHAISEFKKGAYGTLAPTLKFDLPPTAGSKSIDLTCVFVARVAFDEMGHRLGQGGGHYDRRLSEASPTILSVGLACDCQILDRLPIAEHGVPVGMILTPARATNDSGKLQGGFSAPTA